MLNITIYHNQCFLQVSDIFLWASLESRQSWIIRVKPIAGIETVIVAVARVTSITSIAPIGPWLSSVPPGLIGCQPLVRGEEREGKLRW